MPETLPWALEAPGFEHKRFPSCYLTHRLIAGILAIRARHPQLAGEPVDIDIELARGGTAPLKYPPPATGLQAKFSGPFCAAQAWIEGRVELKSLTDGAVTRPDWAAQMQRVVLRERNAEGETLDTAPVFVTLRGATWTERIAVDWAPGSMADPMTRDELRAKWRDCAAYSGLAAGDEQALDLLDAPGDTAAGLMLGPLRELFLAAIAQRGGR